MSEYDEFDDVITNEPFVTSMKARGEIARLRGKHGLAFGHNPGGMYFERDTPSFYCQIGGNDDVEDLRTLREALLKKGLSLE